MQTELRISRIGCLAIHLMPWSGDETLEDAVKRIVEKGPANDDELEAVQKANRENLPDKKICPFTY